MLVNVYVCVFDKIDLSIFKIVFKNFEQRTKDGILKKVVWSDGLIDFYFLVDCKCCWLMLLLVFL